MNVGAGGDDAMREYFVNDADGRLDPNAPYDPHGLYEGGIPHTSTLKGSERRFSCGSSDAEGDEKVAPSNGSKLGESDSGSTSVGLVTATTMPGRDALPAYSGLGPDIGGAVPGGCLQSPVVRPSMAPPPRMRSNELPSTIGTGVLSTSTNRAGFNRLLATIAVARLSYTHPRLSQENNPHAICHAKSMLRKDLRALFKTLKIPAIRNLTLLL